MFNVALFGKKYKDTILTVDSICNGETNHCVSINKRLGGAYNFLENKNHEITYNPITSGVKEAYIVNNKDNSERTSFVSNIKQTVLTFESVCKINVADWLHICYIDDIENFKLLSKVTVPISIDFCNTEPREKYLKSMRQSSIIFDSRERKNLYSHVTISTPIIFHDENGFEIHIDNQIVCYGMNEPIPNLRVNGAGDMFASIFIEKHFNHSIYESAKTAMLKTTQYLINRNKYE